LARSAFSEINEYITSLKSDNWAIILIIFGYILDDLIRGIDKTSDIGVNYT
jgi:hypothetical protein